LVSLLLKSTAQVHELGKKLGICSDTAADNSGKQPASFLLFGDPYRQKARFSADLVRGPAVLLLQITAISARPSPF
jgi:hypothetical protein